MLPVPIPPSWNIRWAEARWLRNSNSSPANSGYMGHQNNKSNSGIYRSSWVQETRPGAAWKRRKTYGLNRKKLRWAGMEGNVQETDLSGFRSFSLPALPVRSRVGTEWDWNANWVRRGIPGSVNDISRYAAAYTGNQMPQDHTFRTIIFESYYSSFWPQYDR